MTVKSCNAMQHAATHCNTLQHTATHCNTQQTIQWRDDLTTLQHTATRCNTLQHAATRCSRFNREMNFEIFIFPYGAHMARRSIVATVS